MRLLVALLVLVPISASSQPSEPTPPATSVVSPAPAPSPAASPLWSIGGGVSVTASIWVGSPGVIAISDSPSADASVERRLNDRSWLVVGASGTAFRYRDEVAPGGYGYTRDDVARLWIRAGVRRVVTPVGAPVDFSVLALGNLGGAWSKSTFESFASTERSSSLAWGVGAEVALAADKALTDTLSVRVATPLANVSWQSSWSKTEGVPTTQHGSSLSGALGLAPRLELRLAF